MKRFIMLSYFFAAAAAAFAQDKNHPVYKFEQNGTPKEIMRYGAAPEFPFLRNLATPQQFVNALHQHKATKELSGILMGIGFEHGAKDVTTAQVAQTNIPEGTIGNMGDAAHNYIYAKLEGGMNGGVKAWKVTADNGESVYFINKCGNAFYQQPTAVSPAAAAVMNEPEQTPVAAVEPPAVCKDKVYVYYGGMKKKHRGWDVYADEIDVQKCTSPYATNPAVVTLTDKPVKVYTTDMQVETTREYLGYRKIERRDERMDRKDYRKEHKKHCGCRARD